MFPDEGGVGGGRDPHGVAQSFVEAAAQSKAAKQPKASWLQFHLVA